MQRHLSVAIYKSFPWIYEKEINGRMQLGGGILFDFIAFCSEFVKFNYTIVESDDKNVGGLEPDGSWSGITGLVQRNEVDFALGPIAASEERLQALHVSPPVLVEEATIVLNWPPGTRSMFAFVHLFEKEVWIGVALTFLYVGLALTVLRYFDVIHGAWAFFFKFLSVQWDLVKTMFQHGLTVMPTSNAIRALLVIWFLIIDILVTSFSGNLVASFTSVGRPFLIETVDDLVDLFKGQIYLISNVPPYDVLKAAENRKYKRLWDRIQRTPGSLVTIEDLLTEDMLARVTDGKAAILLPQAPFHFYLGKFGGNDNYIMREAKEKMGMIIVVMGFSKSMDPSLRRNISLCLSTYISIGLVQRSLAFEFGNYEYNLQSPYSKDVVEPLRIKDLEGPFVIWSIGLAVSSATFMIEMIIFRIENRRNKVSRATF